MRQIIGCLVGAAVTMCAAPARADSISNDSMVLRIEESGAHMRVADSTSLDLTGSMTIEVWARFDATDDNPGAEIVKRGNSNQGYGVGINLDSRIVGSIFGQHSNAITSPPSFGTDWHHFAWTFDGSTSRLYFDGQLVQQVSYSGAAGQTSSDLVVGIGVHGDGTWNGATARGWYDEIRVWNVARSSAQIASAWNVSLAGTESGLVGYWNFDSGSAADLSQYGNHGSLVSGATIVAVPEPATVVLLAFGLLAVRHRRRRRTPATC